ncbi:hypothetical protein [Lentibacter sp. XHP0401]|uniref:hypothetical protein n=1 Tax=Lentibacter sp. XHP0401 TaxID=2984334 RepID=UPI0021E7BF5C|nr:hypothetical protein [Lentibacter sp. XHP0401]MCV2892224.1 hypothetical protein [Lentibacter sp. XHP0401]
MDQNRSPHSAPPHFSFKKSPSDGDRALGRQQALIIQGTAEIRAHTAVNGPSEMPLALDDGRVLRTDKEILDYLDEGDNASAFFDLCGKGPSQ